MLVLANIHDHTRHHPNTASTTMLKLCTSYPQIGIRHFSPKLLTTHATACKTGAVDWTDNSGDQRHQRYHGIDIETAQQDGEGSVLMSKGFRVTDLLITQPCCVKDLQEG